MSSKTNIGKKIIWKDYDEAVHFQIATEIVAPTSFLEAKEKFIAVFCKQRWLIVSLAKLKTPKEKKQVFDFFLGANNAFDGETIRYKDLCIYLGNRTDV